MGQARVFNHSYSSHRMENRQIHSQMWLLKAKSWGLFSNLRQLSARSRQETQLTDRWHQTVEAIQREAKRQSYLLQTEGPLSSHHQRKARPSQYPTKTVVTRGSKWHPSCNQGMGYLHSLAQIHMARVARLECRRKMGLLHERPKQRASVMTLVATRMLVT